MPSRLAIIGPGLLGASIALAVSEKKARGQICEIRVWARSEKRAQEVRERGFADFVSTRLNEVVANSDLIIFCVPTDVMPALAQEMLPAISPTAIITDVGSVKAPVVKSLSQIFAKHGKFIGSHPMAGSEQTGMNAARADLFENAVCIVTPEPETDPQANIVVSEFWQMLGSSVRALAPAEHDKIVALISHLPHLAASLMVNVAQTELPGSLDFCGTGFLDTTRIASGPPEMWTEIFANNQAALRPAIQAMIAKLQQADKILANADSAAMNTILTEAKTQRDRLKSKKSEN